MSLYIHISHGLPIRCRWIFTTYNMYMVHPSDVPKRSQQSISHDLSILCPCMFTIYLTTYPFGVLYVHNQSHMTHPSGVPVSLQQPMIHMTYPSGVLYFHNLT